MKQKELKEAMRLHEMWLRQEEGGERANLSEAIFGGASLRGSNLREAEIIGAVLAWSDLSESDLSRSNLRDADLRGSNFRWSNLRDADLSGAILKWAIGDGERIKTLIGMKYHINIWDDMMSIGCQQYKINEWFSFSDEIIVEMAGDGALEWWSAKKDLIRQLAVEFGALK